mgnify:CR=1 FL=1
MNETDYNARLYEKMKAEQDKYRGWLLHQEPSEILNHTYEYIVGHNDGNVYPNGLISRAETATVFFRLLKDEVRDGNLLTSNTYSDVPDDYWANTAISTMTGLGIVQGCSTDTFDPNAPTTLLQPVAAIEEVVRTNPDSIVIVDEAYIDFAGPNASCVPLTKKYDNVIVVQTFSKSHNLAGARVGFCVANPELIADMNRVKFSYSPYNVNSMTQAAGVAAISDEAYFADVTAKVIAERTHTTDELRRRGFTVFDSATNFLFATTDRTPCVEIFEKLRARGILIRHFNAPRISDYLRITIGTPAQMQRFFAALDEILGI